MAGYFNYSMSNNAVDAYFSGEKPFSKWNKKDFIIEINDYIEKNKNDIENIENFEKVKKMNLKEIKKNFLIKTSYHHTSSYYNITDFYSVDFDKIDSFDFVEYENENKNKNKNENENYRAKCEYLVWKGKGRYKYPEKYISIGFVKNNYFFPDGESFKKNINANGFRILKKF